MGLPSAIMFPLPLYVVAFSAGFCLYWILQATAGRRTYQHTPSQLQLNKDLEEQCSPTNSDSEKTQKSHVPARKALLKKIYDPNENAVVKVISSQGETLAKSVIEQKTRHGIPVAKSKVFLQRTQSDDESSEVLLPIASSRLVASSQNSSSSSPLYNVDAEDEDEEELRALEKNHSNSADIREDRMHQGNELLQSSSSMSSYSPDLPLPPHPQSNEIEVAPTDDPFPPLPDFLDFSGTLQKSNKNVHFVKESYICVDQLANQEKTVEHSHSSEKPSAIILQNNDPDASVLIPVINGNRNQSEFRPYFIDSSPLYCASSASRNTSAEKQGDCGEEAIYVNLDFSNKHTYHKLANESVPYPVRTCIAHTTVSVTNSATQTSDSTPSLQRKFVSSTQVEKLAEFRKSHPRDLQSSSHTNQVSISTETHNEPYQEIQNERVLPSNEDLHSETSSIAKDSSQRENIFLPLTSSYFTTSEPKAKLLTRYCQSFEKEWSGQFELQGQKEVLTESISKKLNILRLEQVELKEEMRQNDELGQDVTTRIEKIAKPNELQKFKVHVEELEKIIKLLMSLSGRLARAENALLILPENANIEEKSFLETKRNKLSQQHDEAWHLKENIDRRSRQVSYFLHHYLSNEEYADYEHFIKMKSKLLMDAIEVDEKIKLGEEQLAALQGTFQVQQDKSKKIQNLTVLDED